MKPNRILTIACGLALTLCQAISRAGVFPKWSPILDAVSAVLVGLGFTVLHPLVPAPVVPAVVFPPPLPTVGK